MRICPPGTTKCTGGQCGQHRHRADPQGIRRQAYLDYVHDVADTHPVRGGKDPWLWKLTEENREPVMERLRDVDQVAYVRFASVYRQFKDIDTFMEELNKLLADNR